MSVAEESVSHPQTAPALAKAEPKGAWRDQYRRALVVSDVGAVCLAVFGAQMFRLGRPITSMDAASVYYSTCSILVIATMLAFLAVYRTRSPRIVGAGTEEYRRVLSATLAMVGVIAVALMIFRPEYARGYLLGGAARLDRRPVDRAAPVSACAAVAAAPRPLRGCRPGSRG